MCDPNQLRQSHPDFNVFRSLRNAEESITVYKLITVLESLTRLRVIRDERNLTKLRLERNLIKLRPTDYAVRLATYSLLHPRR
jgi:hypothetical protein